MADAYSMVKGGKLKLKSGKDKRYGLLIAHNSATTLHEYYL